MLSFPERYFDGADPAAPAAPGRRELLAGSILGYPGRYAELAQTWGRSWEDLAQRLRSSRVGLPQISRRSTQVLLPIEQLSTAQLRRALDPRRKTFLVFFCRLRAHNLIIS